MNFESPCEDLFKEVELSSDLNLIQYIKIITDFKVVFRVRNPGENAEHLFRSGLIGEWTPSLNQMQLSRVWKVAFYQFS